MTARKKELIALGILLVFVGLGAWGVTALSNKSDEPEYLTCQVFYKRDAQVKVNRTTLYAEVADSPEQLQKGLSSRDCIGENQAMLFVFDQPSQYSFWMKDMKFPIDIVWLDAGGKVVKVQPNVSPDSYPNTFTNTEPALYVLELQAGRAESLGLEPGSNVEILFGA